MKHRDNRKRLMSTARSRYFTQTKMVCESDHPDSLEFGDTAVIKASG